MARSGRSRPRAGARWKETPSRRRDDDGRASELQEVGRILRDALGAPRFQRGLALGRLVKAWEEVVGPRLARESAPASLDDGGLVVTVSTAAWGAQVRFLTQEIRRRANEVLGAEEVRAVRVTVGWKPGSDRGGRTGYGEG